MEEVRGEAITDRDLDEMARYIVSTLNRWRGEVLKPTFPQTHFLNSNKRVMVSKKSSWELHLHTLAHFFLL